MSSDGSGNPMLHQVIAKIEEKSKFHSRQLQASQKLLPWAGLIVSTDFSP